MSDNKPPIPAQELCVLIDQSPEGVWQVRGACEFSALGFLVARRASSSPTALVVRGRFVPTAVMSDGQLSLAKNRYQLDKRRRRSR